MASGFARKRAMTRNLTSTLSGIVALLLSIATTVLSILLASYLASQRQKVLSLAIAAIIVQCIAISTVALLLFSHVQEGSPLGLAGSSRGRNLCFVLSSFAIIVVAAVATGFTLGWTYDELEYLSGLVVGNDPADFMLVVTVVYGASALGQLLFFICLIWVRKPMMDYTRPPIENVPQMTLVGGDPSRPATATTVQSVTSGQASPRPPSASASDDHSSLRSSLSIITRPTSSKTRLIRQQSLTRYSRSSSFENSTTARPSQDSGFDAWDTSTVAPHLRETVLHSSPLTTKKPKGTLEPIPGSRSPSPAKALEGPFFATAPESTPPPSPLPQPSYSRPPSRQHSPSSEDHIHPLFRTCSPTPPPTASSNTVVLAAPVAGQLVNERVLRRMRSGSLPSSPSPLVRSESYFDFRTAPTSPSDEVNTPPIPDFILVAGERHALPRATSLKEPPTTPIPGFILNVGGNRDLGRRAASVREGVGV
ncbi:MAG: hypothetical protein Q9191_001501 [Dirinaria sp. TL-2023a]